MMHRRSLVIAIGALASLGLALLLVRQGGLLRSRSDTRPAPGEGESSTASVEHRDPTGASTRPVSTGRAGYATSETCGECHADQHRTWHDSYHRSMTQWATPESVIPRFAGTLESRGRTYQLEQVGDEYWVTMPDPLWDEQQTNQGRDPARAGNVPVKRQRVAMTTGSHVAQTYWVETSGGLCQVPWVYHIDGQQWIPNEDSFLLPPIGRRLFNRWNSNCAKCHTVGLEPGFIAGEFQTRVAEIGIACEACHGPAEEHVRLRRELRAESGVARGATGELNVPDPIINPARLPHDRASEICGQCHSSHSELDLEHWSYAGSRYRAGDKLETHVTLHRPESAETNRDYQHGYWSDGTCRTGGDELLGLVASACFQRGEISCLSCHSLHGYASPADQLKPQFDGNQACLQCHVELRDRVTEHTHHASDSSGSLCFNCHMPHITYGLFKGIRSHRIDSPSAAVTARTGRPNACNLCHLDRPLGWTAEKLTEWYGQPSVDLTESQRKVSHTVTMALSGDAAQRVLAAWHFGWPPARQASGEDWQAPFLAILMTDPYSVVRYVGHRSLRDLPGYDDIPYNFLASPEDAERTRAAVFERQRQQNSNRPPVERPEILGSLEGLPNNQAVREFQGRRDNRLIVIPE